MTSTMTCSSINNDTNDVEQLQLPLHEKEGGILPLRLLEPISSLNLTPFAAKAVRSIGATTVEDVALFVFDPTKECRSLGQGHLEEIRRKIEGFVGLPPYAHEHHFDIASLLRLSLSGLELSERALLITFFRLQHAVFLTPQESREAEVALLRDKDRKLKAALEKAREKTGEKTLELLSLLFNGLLQPWIIHQGGVAHEQEIYLFFFERQPLLHFHPSERNKSCDHLSELFSPQPSQQTGGTHPLDFDFFKRSIRLFTLITNLNFLFSQHLFHVTGKLWAVSEQKKEQAQAILHDAETLIGKEKGRAAHLNDLAKSVRDCRVGQWEACSKKDVRRILFWHYYEQ